MSNLKQAMQSSIVTEEKISFYDDNNFFSSNIITNQILNERIKMATSMAWYSTDERAQGWKNK